MNFFLEDRAMDFHSLTRRQLQSLCKKNKIPANMTNVAMADALSSLTTVEGIEDIGKSMPETPLTTRKTVAATKPIKRETDLVESSKGVARPNRAPLTENPSGSGIIIPSTPTTRSCRKKDTGTLVSRKIVCKIEEDSDVGKEVPVVNHGYSTRRSSRLQQKSGVKVFECVQKAGGGRNDAVKIEMLSEEENDGDTKSEVTSDVQQKNDVVKIEMVSVEEDSKGTESKPEVTSGVQHKNDAVKIEMLSEEENDEEMKSQSEVTSEVQEKNEGHKVEVLKEELDDIDSGNLSNTMHFVESLVLEQSRDLEEFSVDSDGDQDGTSEGSSSTLIMREVSRDNISETLDGCTSEDSSAPKLSVEESTDIALYKSSPVEEEAVHPKYLNEHQSMAIEDQSMEINEVVECKGAQDLELKFVDENELSDVKVTEVKSENLEDLNVDEGNCKLTSEIDLYDIKGTEVCTSEVSSAPIVSVEESMDVADVLSKSSLMGENSMDKNEDQNMESETQSVETNGVETGVTHDLEFKCTHEGENSGVKFTEVEAIFADGSPSMVAKNKNLGNTNEVVEIKAALDLESKFAYDNEPSDVKFTEVEGIHTDVASPTVEKTENLEDSNVVVEVKAASDLNLKNVDEDELGDFNVTKADAFYVDKSSPVVEKTENLEDLSVAAEVKAAPDLDLKFADEDELSDVNVSDVEAIYADTSSPMVEKTENLDISNLVVEFKATPNLELKFVDENELSDIKDSEVQATYADESSLMVEKAENLEDSNVVVEVKAAHDLELKFTDEEAEAIYADESSPMVEKTENLEYSNCKASKAEEFESMKGSMKEVISSLEDKECNLEAQLEDTLLVLTEVEAAMNDESETQMVGLEKSDSISDDLEITAILDDDVNWSSDDETSSYEFEEDFDTKAPNSDTMGEMEDNELDVEEEISAAAVENEDCSGVDISNAVEEYSNSPSVNATVNETAMPVATPTKTVASENVVRGTTPLKSSTKKNAATTPKSFIIFNESSKLGVRSASKVANKVVPKEKENTGESTAKRKLKATSVRQLKKMIKQLTLKDSKNTVVKEQVHVGKKPALQHNKRTTVKEQAQVGKRAALQQLSDNCLADDKSDLSFT
ncbi:hypothetical protein MKX01_025798 [Papaver californicum]|nr:hypothetical protein MKX01_025798 [Papaver californicum]